MTKEELRTKYERIHFTESDTAKGKLKQGYAKWLEKELIEQLNLHLVSYCDCSMCDSTNLEDCGGDEYSCKDCGHFPITA